MSKSFKFWPDQWLNNRSLRLCSPAARGFWVDIMALSFPSGYLVTATGYPITDAQLAQLVGATSEQVREWFAELGQQGIFGVDDDGRLCVPSMVKKSTTTPAKAVKKPRIDRPARSLARDGDDVAPLAPPPTKPASRTAAWWQTPAGWAAKGNSQACGIKPGEAIEEFQIRLSVKLPPGPHLEALSDYQRKAIEQRIPKDPNAS